MHSETLQASSKSNTVLIQPKKETFRDCIMPFTSGSKLFPLLRVTHVNCIWCQQEIFNSGSMWCLREAGRSLTIFKVCINILFILCQIPCICFLYCALSNWCNYIANGGANEWPIPCHKILGFVTVVFFQVIKLNGH